MTFDLDSRNPCLDDACTGVLDGQGRCGTCGRQATPEELSGLALAGPTGPDPSSGDFDEPEGQARIVAAVDMEGGEPSAPATADAATGGSSVDPGDGADLDGGFDPGRRLCPDGSCIGVIGPDGRCKVCGQADDASVGAS